WCGLDVAPDVWRLSHRLPLAVQEAMCAGGRRFHSALWVRALEVSVIEARWRRRTSARPVDASARDRQRVGRGGNLWRRATGRRRRPRDRASERREMVALLSNPRVPRHDHSLTRLRRIPRQGLGLQTEVGHALVGVTWRRAYNYHSRLAKC